MKNKITVFDREWTYNDRSKKWTSNWYCPDGDPAQLLIPEDESGFELQFLSGIPACSKIVVDKLDFATLAKKLMGQTNNFVFIADTKTKCIWLADLLCRKFCEWIDTSDYKPAA